VIKDRPSTPKLNVTFSEGNSAFWAGIRRRSVFSNAKEVEERNNHHVSNGCVVLDEIVSCGNGGDGGHWDSKFWLGGRVFIIKSF
jgi:hypothetical protein